MSSATIALEPRDVRVDADVRPGLARLTAVELRKMVDTRAGFWLQLGVLGLTLTFVVLQTLLGPAADHTLENAIAAAIAPAYWVLPVVGILLVSSEWTQRTTLVTFALVPKRVRVLAAKLAAAVLLSSAGFVVALALATTATAIAAPDVTNAWSLSGTLLGQELILILAAMIMGLGYGAMLLSSAPAIVLSFGLPLAWTALGSIPALTGTARWLDGARSFQPMTEHVMNGTEWARVGTTLLVWMVLPLLIGLWRIRRNEVS
jgi:ABC-2 type transport system permease protein